MGDVLEPMVKGTVESTRSGVQHSFANMTAGLVEAKRTLASFDPRDKVIDDIMRWLNIPGSQLSNNPTLHDILNQKVPSESEFELLDSKASSRPVGTRLDSRKLGSKATYTLESTSWQEG